MRLPLANRTRYPEMKIVKLSVLWAARTAGLFRLFRHFTSSKVRIVCYHGGCLGDEHMFNPLLFCHGELLDQRLTWMRKAGFTIISLADAVALLGSDTVRPRLPAVLTFDDGWYSTYRTLHPVVARHRVPATLYLCTSYYLERRPNVEVAIAYLIWRAESRSVSVVGLNKQVDGDYDLTSTSGRTRLRDATTNWLRQGDLGSEAVCAALERLGEQLGLTSADLDFASRRFDFVYQDELREMLAGGWSVELHGHLHLYPAARPESLPEDIARCRAAIRDAGLPEANHYCYPSGDHDAAAGRYLEALGVRSATTCMPGLIDRADGMSRFYLSRLLDGERIHRLEFEAEMSGFSDFLRWLANLGRIAPKTPREH